MSGTKHIFKAAVKKTTGYEIPKGPIVLWNDLCSLIHNTWDINVYNEKKQAEMFEEMKTNEDAYKALRWHNRWNTYNTPMGDAVDKFSGLVLESIYSGHTVLLQREDINGILNTSKLPQTMLEKDTCGLLVNLNELRTQLDVLLYLNKGDKQLTKGFDKISEFLDRAEEVMCDHSGIKLNILNSPINKNDLKNSIYKKIAHEKSQKQAEELRAKLRHSQVADRYELGFK